MHAAEGMSLMEAIRDNGFDQLLAMCGGGCSCAPCHVHVDPAYTEKLPSIIEDEGDLLDSLEDRHEISRLSCQIPLSASLVGLTVRIAAEDWS